MRQEVDPAEAAVMQVIDAESRAYLARDYAAWARCWVQAPHTRRFDSHSPFGPTGVYKWSGFDEQGERMKRFMAEHPAPSAAGYRHESVSIRVLRDMAWVTFDQYATGAAGPEIDMPESTYEIRILEKGLDGWKIACLCAFQRSFDHVSSALIRVDAQGAVRWMNAAAEAETRSYRSLVIRAGRLRAASRAADQRLQAAIRWAAPVDDRHFIWPRHGALPVVLDGGRGEAANVCWVIARSNQILVAINDRRMTEERLAASAAIYGITPAQLRLATLIIAGEGLVTAAKQLGVSVNTARTHLQRMFDKTGARSQPALVRALLSAATPLG